MFVINMDTTTPENNIASVPNQGDEMAEKNEMHNTQKDKNEIIQDRIRER